MLTSVRVPESEIETPSQSKDIFAKEVTKHMGITIQENYIRQAHRLGKRKANGKPRPIIARIWDSELRNHIYFNKKACKGKPIAITENLTKRRIQMKSAANLW